MRSNCWTAQPMSLIMERVSRGNLSPVFFGSALTNFGVETFLQHFLKMTTSPLPRKAITREISPFNDDFSAFVFKIQANMNKAHRDRIAFMRIVSGKFRGRHGSKPCPGRQEDPPVPAAADDGAGPKDRREKLTPVISSVYLIRASSPSEIPCACPTRSLSLRASRPSRRSILPACARSTP